MQIETREQWLNAFKDKAAPLFASAGYPIPSNVRISIGFTSGGTRGKRIGECWGEAASSDGSFEIFIKPSLLSDARIADVLTHELIHAAVGLDAKHGKVFKACATALGLEGKMTATTAGEGWYAWALPLLDQLGPMPYAAITGNMGGKKKQATALLKVECDNHECGWLARVTLKHLEPHDTLDCPTGCGGSLTWE